MNSEGRVSATVDSVALLTVFIVVLIGIPSRLIIGPLGSAGTPAGVLGLVLVLWWIGIRLSSGPGPRVRQPVRIAMLIVVGSIFASYIAASTRPISADERQAADLGLLIVVSWLGIVLVAMDLIANRARLDILLRRLVVGGAALASLGIVQFVTGQAFTNYIQIPGLSANTTLVSVLSRGGLTRPAGTTIHPIEFGAVLTMILPLALHFAVSDKRRGALARWYPVVAIAVTIPISISRSAIVSSAIVLAFVLPTWTRSARRVSYGALVVLAGFIYVTVPGLLGTITGLFTGISSDTSAQSRTNSYGIALAFIERNPLFGRGFPTFLPAYQILDNQYLGLLIDTGFVGLIAVLGLFVTSLITARSIRRRSRNEVDRQLAVALAASIGSATVSFAFFDAFSFPMASGLLFLLVGCIGAFRRLCSESDTSDSHSELASTPVIRQ